MNMIIVYALCGIGLFIIGLHGLIIYSHLLRKILALNIMGSGVFLLLIALGRRTATITDPVPQAMVITGIVVAVAATALALALLIRLNAITGQSKLAENKNSTAPHD